MDTTSGHARLANRLDGAITTTLPGPGGMCDQARSDRHVLGPLDAFRRAVGIATLGLLVS